MNHLPFPIDHGGHDKVYFYAKQVTYHPEDFFTLPREYGYDDLQDLLENGFKKTMKDRDANELLQSWLWLALLAQVLNIDIHWRDFHKNDDTLISTKLNRLIAEWASRERETADGVDEHRHAQTSRYARASIALDIAQRFITKHCAHELMDRDSCSPAQERVPSGAGCPNVGCRVDQRLDTKLTLSLAILGETLQLERPEIPAGLNDRLSFYYGPNIQEKNWGHSTYCREMFAKNDWCPFEIRRLESTLVGVTNAYFVSRMKPPKPKVDHSDCNAWVCVAKRPMQTALHMGSCDGSNCKTDKIDEAKLVEWINQGKTPLVTFKEATGMECSPHDLKKEKGVTFVALSHSWEDGMVDSGRDARNKNDRCMHRCQLEKAQGTCNRLLKGNKNPDGSKEIYLWIDVLCIPRQASVMGSAINQMRNIFLKAATVLVWDRNLIQTPKTGSAIEMNMRIRMSSWAQRLWTLQEAVLANNLHVQFKDDTVSLKELEEARDEAKNDIDHRYHYVWKTGHPFSSAVWKLRQPKEVHQVPRAWEAVQFRSVAEPEDETIVLANVLKLNVKELEHNDPLKVKDPEEVASVRMVKFLHLLDKQPGLGIPSGIIFLPPPKLRVEGYGWAPRTWLTKQAHAYPLIRPLRQAGSMMKQGFLVEFPGLILHCPSIPLEEKKFWIPVQQSLHKWYRVVADQGSNGRDFKDFWGNHVSRSNEPSIILTTHNPKERWEIGLLVQTKGLLTRGEVRWVRTLCRVWIRLETNTNIIRDLGNQFREKADAMIFGERLEMQKWCIDGDNY
ncbi:hypothetical protein MMC20_004147 [Loxospora ochrophaea]|nr:hypothetical protein [Loxospora ochrophaea]